ncbi:cofactor-independent phosphoglycerate mutase [Candidatus Omnitrophota bacterium]
MKYAVLIPDGMADYPLEELQGRTPLEVAETPNMDLIAQRGQVGLVTTVPKGMTPGSDVANLAILGYDPKEYYVGRGPLEAANLGVELQDDEIAFRCNLITAEGNTLIDYSAGHISNKEATILIKFLNKKLGSEAIRFYPGVSYRHLMVIKTDAMEELLGVKCFPPHDIMGGKISKHLPKGKSAALLLDLMNKSRELLTNHEINHVRIDLKENPANMIWLWGQGTKPDMPRFVYKFGINGAVISAVDLIKGIAKVIGLDVIKVPGATGYYDTNYRGKANYAIKALKSKDFVFVHVEATDEAGHNGDLRMKIACIEKFDQEVVGPIMKHFSKDKEFRLLVTPDHATPIKMRTHADDPVCFAMYGKGIQASNTPTYCEKTAKEANVKFEKGHELMRHFIKQISL